MHCKITLLTCIIVFSLPSFAQKHEYSTFLYPDVDFSTWRFSTTNDGASMQLQGDNYNSLNVASEMGYFRFKNTRQLQRQTNVDASTDYRYQKNNIFNQSKYGSANAFTALSFLNRNYENSDNGRFLQTGIKGQYRFNYFRSEESSTGVFQGRRSELNFSIPIGIGKGRIEPVGEVFQAKFLLDDLVAQGLWTQEVNQGDIYTLATLMAKVRNTRVLDQRRQRVYEWKQLGQWLEKNCPNNVDKVALMATLIDNHTFNLPSFRSSGSRSTWLGTLNGSHYWQDETSNNEFDDFSANFQAGFQLYQTKPVSQFLQKSFYSEAGASLLVDNFQNFFYLPFINAGYAIGYYPNSRTLFGASVEGTARGLFDMFDAQIALGANLSVSSTYFINYNSTIQFSLGLNSVAQPIGRFWRQYTTTNYLMSQPSNDFVFSGLNNMTFMPNFPYSLFGQVRFVHFIR